MSRFGSSAPLRLGLIVVLAVVVRFVTHDPWLALLLPVTYFIAKEVVGAVQPGAVAAALLAAEPRVRFAAFACDNAGFLAAILGYFVLHAAPAADGLSLVRFAAFEVAIAVLVALWGFIGTAALRRSAGVGKV